MQITRAQWRDAIREPGGPLTMNARHVAVTMADYWPKTPGDPLWCPVETLAGHTAGSVRTVNRALVELRAKGFLKLVTAASLGRAARHLPTIPDRPDREAQAEVDKCQLGTCTDANLADVEAPSWHPTLDVTPNKKLDSELNSVTADASTAQEINLPEQRDPEAASAFEDWRPGDQELFAEAIGCTHITSDGTGPWNEGTWPVASWYQAFRKRSKNPMRWPGTYFKRLADDGTVEEYLASFGLEPSEADADPWAQTKGA